MTGASLRLGPGKKTSLQLDTLRSKKRRSNSKLQTRVVRGVYSCKIGQMFRPPPKLIPSLRAKERG